MWFEFDQNNSGGSFGVDEKICHRLYIEANTMDEAIEKAEGMGVYFDGVENEMDCPCCGDRWNRPWNGKEFPYQYGCFDREEAEIKAKRYGIETAEPKEKSKWTDGKLDLVFPTIEAYAQYMANDYGWTEPDIRIFYKDGKVVEIFHQDKTQEEEEYQKRKVEKFTAEYRKPVKEEKKKKKKKKKKKMNMTGLAVGVALGVPAPLLGYEEEKEK